MFEIQISPLDRVVLIAYFLAVSIIGLVAATTIKDTDSYFLGSRGFGKLLITAVRLQVEQNQLIAGFE